MAWVRTPILLFLIAVLAIGGGAVAALAMHDAVRRSNAVATEEALDLGEVERLRGLRERVSRKMRSFLLIGDERFLEELRESVRAFNEVLSSLRSDANTPEERELIGRIEEHERMRRALTDRLIATRRTGMGPDSVVHMLDGDLQPILDTLDATISKLVGFHQRQVEQARAESDATFSKAARALWAAAAVALFMAALTSVALARTLRRIEGRAGRLQRERDRFFDLSVDMVCVAGMDGYFKQLNPAFELTLGHARADLLRRPILEFVHVDDHEATAKEVEKLSTGRPTIDFENRYICKDGTSKWLSWHASFEPGGAVYAVARDVTERKANQEKLAALTEELRIMATMDELTGLHNRRGFNILAEQHLKQAQRSQQKAVFLLADLDGLKQINDQLGHDVGDRALRDAGTLLVAAFRKSDIVARLGGDEFVVLATDAASDPVQTLIDRFQELVRQFSASEPPPPFPLAISIGWTIYDPAQSETLDDILRRADAVMYKQKAHRRATPAAHPDARSPVAAGGAWEAPK